MLLALLVGSDASAQPLPGAIPLADVLQVLVVDRDVLAIDGAGGGQTVARLRLDETVLWQGSRGKIGVVLTDERVLAAATQSGSWQESEYRRTEVAAVSAWLGERVAIVVTSERVLGFDGESGNLVEFRLGLRENVIGVRTGANVGVVVTNRHALGISPFIGGFFRVSLDLRDPIENIAADSNIATVTSARRILIFRASTGTWEERARDLH